MRISYEYLDDTDFLRSVDSFPIQETYIKIIVLNWDESPLSEIQGIVSDGSINITNSSTVRRTADLTVLLDDSNNKLTSLDNLFSLNKKVYIELGYKNFSNQYMKYPILWYPQGIFVMTSVSLNYGTGGQITASLSLQDKMCLLNGDVGGTFPASVSLSSIEELNAQGEYYTTYPTIYQMIFSMVQNYGGEDADKIIITDVPEYIDRVIAWKPIDSSGKSESILFYDEDNYLFSLTSTGATNEIQYKYGEDIGKTKELFIWPSKNDLTVSAGSSVTSALDEIIKQLGNFEYFYDVYGNFVFQEIKNYLNTSEATTDLQKLEKYDTITTDNNQTIEDEGAFELGVSASGTKYSFNDNKLFISYSNAPVYSNIKNDYIIWGKREDSNGNEIPIRYHVAIDSKPEPQEHANVILKSVEGTDSEQDSIIYAYIPVSYSSENNFPKIGSEGYFYLDVSTEKLYTWNTETLEYEESEEKADSYYASDWRTELYLRGLEAEALSVTEGSGSNYYAELKVEWPKLYNLEEHKLKYNNDNREDISSINYWLDFIDEQSDAYQYNVDSIGRRIKAIDADSSGVNCIFEPEIESIYIQEYENNDQKQIYEELGYDKENDENRLTIVPSEIYQNCATGGSSNGAFEYFRDTIYQDLSYGESIQITSIPIYYLEPNNLISLYDNEANIYGNYMIESISYNFGNDATMNLNCQRALSRI